MMEEWNDIQERLKKIHCKMKLQIKEVMCQLAFSEDTMLFPPQRKAVTKRAKKMVRSTPKKSSTCRILSMWERVDSQFPDSQSPQTKSSFSKRKNVCYGHSSCSPVSIPTIHLILDLPYITQMSKIIKTYIENIVNVKGDGNYGYQVIARHMGMNEENHLLVRSALIHELKTNKRDYFPIFRSDERFEYIMNDLHPTTNSGGIVYIDKWLTLSDMSHIVATWYNRVVV